MTEWEAEVKIWRNGRLFRRERATGNTPVFAFESASNDLALDLEDMESRDRWKEEFGD